MAKDLPQLGVGMGYREFYRADLFLNRQAVDFLEITADHFFDGGPEKKEELELLAENFILIPHGLNLSLGSADGLDQEYVEKFAALVERLDPPWWSEHIAFTRIEGMHIGHLTPVPFTNEALDILCANIELVRRSISKPLILENISFLLDLPGCEMPESNFLRKVLERSGCGLLLDVTNLHANARNHQYDPLEFLDSIPLDKVAQLHFVGGIEKEDKFIDSHSTATSEAIWELIAEVLDRCQPNGMILERDEDFPPFVEIETELARARSLLHQSYRHASSSKEIASH